MNASALADEEGRKLFIGGLSFDAREDDLRNDFGKFGDLEDLQLPYVDGKHKGFAFLTYYKAEDAQAASKEHHQREYFGREISARVVVPRDQRGDRGGDRGDRGGGRSLPPISRELEEKLDEWVAAKRKRDFETSDRLRSELQDAGVTPEEYRPKPGYQGGGGGGYGGGDRYGDRGGDRYGDRGGDRYGDRGGDRYGDRGGDRYGDDPTLTPDPRPNPRPSPAPHSSRQPNPTLSR